MNGNVNPMSIKQQAVALREQSSFFVASCNKLINAIDSISYIVSSEDGGMGNSIKNLVNSYVDIGSKANIRFNELADSMDNWADFTVKCEQESKEKIQHITNGLNDIGVLLDKLK